MPIAVIANPLSSRGGGRRHRDRLVRLLDEAGLDYEIFDTTAPGIAIRTGHLAAGSAGQLARSAAARGFDIVAAAGGDGTIGEVVNGLAGTQAILAVLPMGTGNDFSRTIGFGTDLVSAVDSLRSPQTIEIDLPAIDGRGFFVNVAGTGFDAVVAERINRGYRYLRGTTAYVVAVLQTLGSFKPAAISIEIDGVTHDQRAMLCAVANAQSYGGGMKIAPLADLSDGLLDVVVVGEVGRAEFLRAFPSVFKGSHLSHPKVSHHRGARIRLSCERPLPFLADGEEVDFLPASVSVGEQRIRVVKPTRV